MNTTETIIIDKHFCDWYHSVWGYGYGTGEAEIVPALKAFIERVASDGKHDYNVTEQQFGKLAAWMLIDAMCAADMLEYGTSSRHGWLSERGAALHAYLRTKTDDELYEIVNPDDMTSICEPDLCHCKPPCRNPLWRRD